MNCHYEALLEPTKPRIRFKQVALAFVFCYRLGKKKYRRQPLQQLPSVYVQPMRLKQEFEQLKLRMSRHEDEVAQMTFMMNSRLSQELRVGSVTPETKLIQTLKQTVTEQADQLNKLGEDLAQATARWSDERQRLEYDI